MVNPRRDVPRSLLTTMLVVTLVYASIQWVAAGTFSGLASAKAPLASAAAQFMGAIGGGLMTVGAVCSITGTMSGLMLAGPRVTYALAQNHQLPAWFGTVHPRFRTPYFFHSVSGRRVPGLGSIRDVRSAWLVWRRLRGFSNISQPASHW
jgi:amino acid transporter